MNAIVEALLKSKKMGEKWGMEALPVLVAIKRNRTEIENAMEEETTPLKVALEEARRPYKERLVPLDEDDKQIREKMLEKYEGDEPLKEQGVGIITFPKRTTFEITDINRVDRKYLTLDNAKVKEDIKKGINNIRGIAITKIRGVEVRPEK